MKPAILHNATSLPIEKIPVLEMNSFRRFILDTCGTAGGRVMALFGAGKNADRTRLVALEGIDNKKEILIAATDVGGSFPSLTPELPEVHLFERELFEEFGVKPEGHRGLKPVRRLENYPFFRREGEGIHEVAVGPVHAGIIEPGHFRFQCHGEKVLHLEIALGYQHRAAEKLLVSSKPTLRSVVAESIAGDTVIGHAMASAEALEALAGQTISERAHELRAIALELERLANHVGDLGMLSADVGFLPASAWFGRLRGEFLNLLLELTGNRFGRSFVRPGGVLFDLKAPMIDDFKKRLLRAETDFKQVTELFFSSATVLGRLEHTGIVSRDTAKSLGLVGPAARASHLLRDVRHDHPTGAYRSHPIQPVRLTSGDVYGRGRVRSLETKRSIGWILQKIGSLSTGEILHPTPPLKPSSLALSLVEGWRGEIAHIVLTGETGDVTRYKVIDPSFHNWDGLASALRDGEISDFPLCNKSFNLSYAGHDL